MICIPEPVKDSPRPPLTSRKWRNKVHSPGPVSSVSAFSGVLILFIDEDASIQVTILNERLERA